MCNSEPSQLVIITKIYVILTRISLHYADYLYLRNKYVLFISIYSFIIFVD